MNKGTTISDGNGKANIGKITCGTIVTLKLNKIGFKEKVVTKLLTKKDNKFDLELENMGN